MTLLISFLLRWRHKKVKEFYEMMTKIVLYDLLYIVVGTLMLVIALNLNLVLTNVDATILALFISAGSGLSWVATLIPIGLIISLIRYHERKH
ncbi:MAG TPA: hypothetical protein VJ249_09725 [Candidatus Bathyarchaeia archaeon]|nr:hypothetical protein [Candidatus Bathyarchaeia archaeon]